MPVPNQIDWRKHIKEQRENGTLPYIKVGVLRDQTKPPLPGQYVDDTVKPPVAQQMPPTAPVAAMPGPLPKPPETQLQPLTGLRPPVAPPAPVISAPAPVVEPPAQKRKRVI